MARSTRTRLALEHLETRETPSLSATEPFDAITPPALPAGWGEWSNDGTDVFQTAAGQGVGGSGGLVSAAGSRTAALAWHPQQATGDTGVAASVKVDTRVPTFVFARGTDLGSAMPSYLAAVVTRGVTVELVEVRGETRTVLGSVASPGSAYFSGGWLRVSLVPSGTTAAVQVTRADTGQFLNADATWQAGETAAITGKTSIPNATGFAGVGRAAAVWGPVQIDDFALVAPPAPQGTSDESFDDTTVGVSPDGWANWASDSAGGFQVVAGRANSTPNGFASNGGSTSAARSWADVAAPADVSASVAVYLDSLVAAQLFVRGSALDTPAPTYYGVTLTRGLDAKLVRVVNGVETQLGAAQSAGYFSAQWVRVHLTAEGDRLRVTLYRTDTRQWLTPDGLWSDSPDFALEVRDNGITGGGGAGVGRGAKFSGPVTFDDFAAEPASATGGPVVTLAPVAATVSGEATFRATVTGTASRIEFRLNNQLRDVESVSPAEWTFDSTTVPNGTYTLTVRAFDASGDFGSAERAFTVANANATPIAVPDIPRHYDHIRIAALAYSGNPLGDFEKQLLRESVDVVVPNPRYLATIEATSAATPQVIYSNVSNLYQGLLTDWLNFADRTAAKRELAFYHVTKATAFSGNSSSSQPVTWFWGTHQTTPNGTTDVTSAARGGRNFNVTFGGAGVTTSVSYPDKFRELNVTLVKGGAGGWGGVWEYVSAADASGNPTAWKTLTLLSDGTTGLTKTGTITFDPPADWKTSSPTAGADRLFSVRFRVTSGTAAQSAELKTLLGRDYVRAGGTTTGVIPAFDTSADGDGDGYLTDTEFATRRAGFDARFFYESRLFYPYYGQMRFVTNPSSSALRGWAAEYHDRLLTANPLADGVFLDNAHGKLPFAGISVLEPTGTYSTDSGALTAAVSRRIAPQWVMANTAGGTSEGDGITAGSASVVEEFLLRPMQANWSEVGDAANLVARRLAASSSPYVVLDTYPGGGSPTDPRTQLGALAYYYLVADPDRTMLMFFGGSNPSSTWKEHWTAAATVNVGQPTAAMRVFATGTDPANAALTYKVFARDYGNALVLYKPLSYATGKSEGTTADATATTHQLGGNYRAVNADGTLGPVVRQVALRNGEGAVLVKA